MSTDPFAFADSTSLYAVVFVVDEAHQDGLGTLVDVFGSPDVASCLTAALQAADTTSDTTFAPGAFVITNESDLGLGDQSASLTSSIHFEFNGVSTDINSEVAMARVDRALAVAFSDWSGDTEPDFSAEDALATRRRRALARGRPSVAPVNDIDLTGVAEAMAATPTPSCPAATTSPLR